VKPFFKQSAKHIGNGLTRENGLHTATRRWAVTLLLIDSARHPGGISLMLVTTTTDVHPLINVWIVGIWVSNSFALVWSSKQTVTDNMWCLLSCWCRSAC
jgi:hypothetical protein